MRITVLYVLYNPLWDFCTQAKSMPDAARGLSEPKELSWHTNAPAKSIRKRRKSSSAVLLLGGLASPDRECELHPRLLALGLWALVFRACVGSGSRTFLLLEKIFAHPCSQTQTWF